MIQYNMVPILLVQLESSATRLIIISSEGTRITVLSAYSSVCAVCTVCLMECGEYYLMHCSPETLDAN